MDNNHFFGEVECDDLEKQPSRISANPAQQRVTPSPSVDSFWLRPAHDRPDVSTANAVLTGRTPEDNRTRVLPHDILPPPLTLCNAQLANVIDGVGDEVATPA